MFSDSLKLDLQVYFIGTLYQRILTNTSAQDQRTPDLLYNSETKKKILYKGWWLVHIIDTLYFTNVQQESYMMQQYSVYVNCKYLEGPRFKFFRTGN